MVISIIECFLQEVNADVEYFLKNIGGDFTIYKRVIEICKKRGMSIRAVERIAGLGNGTISGWSRCSPTIEKLKAVADALNCTVDDLIREQEVE